MVIIVTYDLHNPGRSYAPVKALLESVPHAHPQGSVWFIDTGLTPDQVVAKLRGVGDANDEFFAARISKDWQAVNQDPVVSQWLNSSFRNW